MSIEARISTIANGFSAASLARVASLQVPISFLPPIELKDLSPDILCGQNLGLKDLTDKKTLIKLLLKIPKVKGIAGSVQRNATVVQLVALAANVKEKYEMVQSKIEAVYSFQNDIASIKSDPSPANIARVAQRYKGKVPGLDRYIQLASDATNLTELDICDLIPNISFNPETGAVSVNAKKSLFPSENPEAAEPLIPSVKDFFTDKSKSPSGISQARLKEYESKVAFDLTYYVLDPSLKAERDTLLVLNAALKNVETSGVFVKTKTYGKTPEELQSLGLLTLSEIQYVDYANEARKASEFAIMKTQILAAAAKPEAMYAKNNDKNAFFDFKKLDPQTPQFIYLLKFSLDKIDKIAQANKELIADYVAHLNASKPEDVKLAIKAGENLVALQEPPVHINTVARPTNTRGRV
jgi:hypothetical protein